MVLRGAEGRLVVAVGRPRTSGPWRRCSSREVRFEVFVAVHRVEVGDHHVESVGDRARIDRHEVGLDEARQAEGSQERHAVLGRIRELPAEVEGAGAEGVLHIDTPRPGVGRVVRHDIDTRGGIPTVGETRPTVGHGGLLGSLPFGTANR